jgi:hypothetical protein
MYILSPTDFLFYFQQGEYIMNIRNTGHWWVRGNTNSRDILSNIKPTCPAIGTLRSAKVTGTPTHSFGGLRSSGMLSSDDW